MNCIRTKDVKTWGKRLLSFVLAAALVLGLIPESASAAGAQRNVADKTIYTSGDCEITYQETNAWGTYVNADITIKNNGEETIEGWKLELRYDGSISNIWNADILSAEDGICTITAKAYNSTIGSGQTVSFGFTACGEKEKPDVPLGISIEGEEEAATQEGTTGQQTTEQETTERPGEDGPHTGGTVTVPEKWKGFGYALFTSGDETLSLYTNETSIYGNVHSNKDFHYQGNSIKVDGTLEAAGSIDLKTASGKDSQQVGRKQEKAESLEMPDITNEVYEYGKENGTVYDRTTDFNSDSIVMEKPVVVEGSAGFHAATFLGKGIVYARDSVTCNVGTLATPEDSRVFIAAENGNITLNGSDITLNAVLYAPNGCVSINADRVTLNGRILAKQVRINGRLINIKAGPHDLDMLDFLFQPEAGLHFDGKKKENRKVTIDVETNTEDAIQEDTVWSITKDGREAGDSYAADEEASSAFHREMIFREAGTYQVSVTVRTGKADHTVTEEVVIEKDLEPAAAFELEQGYYSRDEKGNARIILKDASSSPDGDTIGQRIWTVYYDKDNNGEFTEQEASVYSDENETELVIDTDKVGRYKVMLTAVETFTDTIPKLITGDAYLRDDTSEYVTESCVFEVGNEAPQARLSVEKSRSADIVFTLGDADRETLDIYRAKAEELRKDLKEKGVDARVDTVSASMLTAQDTFAWKEYDHYNFPDKFLPKLEKHILYEGDDIRMVGYSEHALNDFLYIADDNPGKKTFEFDLQRDSTDWHSIEGGGFLFNTAVSDEKNTIKGFCILVSQTGLKLVQIDCNHLANFRNGAYRWLQDTGKLLRTYPVENLYGSHHFRIVADTKTVSVWDGETLVIDDFVLPENDYGYGFGPITSHNVHGCDQQSYFTFKNIRMETMTGSSLSDIVAGYGWRPGASHYVISLSETEVPELEETADLAAALIQNEAVFVGIGNESNENQYKSLLNAAGTGGIYTETGEIGKTMDKVNDFLAEDILSRDCSVDRYLTTDDIISYGGYYQDAENDGIYEQQWEYEYDPSVFGGAAGEAGHIVRKESEPLTTFTETGAYAIRLKVRDNPAGDNDALDSYRLWSGTEEYEKLVVVQTRPAASVKAEVSGNASDKTVCMVNTIYEASDADHPGDADKGIREEYYAYKNVKDSGWTEGRMPNRVTVGETYLVKYRVKDVEGTWSFPAAAVIKTRDLLSGQEIEDTTPPEIFIEASRMEAKAGEELRIEGWASDDYGVDTFTMSINGEKVLDAFGRVRYTPDRAGTVTVKARAVDIGGNESEKELVIRVADDRDRTAPVAEITSPSAGSELDFNVQIRGTAKDETKFSRYTLSYKEEKDKEYTVFKESDAPVSDDILGNLDISGFTDGTYEILLAAEDAAGNVSYYGIVLYIETGVTRGYRLKAEITDVRYNEGTDAVDIYGTVTGDGHLERYSLGYQYQAEELSEMTAVCEGTEETTEGLLGSIPAEGLVPGTYHLTLAVTDTEGNSGTACGAFTYREETEEGEGEKGQPEISMDLNAPEAEITGLKLSDDQGYVEIKGTAKDDKELKGWLLDLAEEGSEEYTELASGAEAVEDAPLASIPAEILEDGSYTLCLQAWDAYGNSIIYRTGFTYKKGSGSLETGNGTGSEEPVPGEPVKKNFAVNLSHSAADIGTEVQVQVTLPDNVKEGTLQIRQGDQVISEGSRKAAFTSDKAGTVTITAAGVTEEGETITAEARCTFYNLTDKNPPAAAITSPKTGTVLTGPVDFLGSAYDAEGLNHWKLEYRMAGEKEYILLNEGTEPIKDGVLGHFDTTMLMNGQYDVKLTVQDQGGNVRRVENDYVVEGELKVGAMHIGFTDITAQMGGTSVSANRMYDSRNKAMGDFGIGWTLGVQGMEICESSTPLSEGYEMVKSGSVFSTSYQMTETESHDVVVTYGDGSSDRFELTFTPEKQALVPISEVKLGYKCVTDQKVKLEFAGDTTAYVAGSELMFYDEAMEDARSYKLTTEDGTEIYIRAGKGVYKMEDRDGNVITVDEDGYHAEDGRSITFTRDAEGRIVKAEDPAGNVTRYAYDDAGDLVSVTDSADRTVTFTYDKEHNLASITDPMGVAVARNEYDDDGRLIATIDADGNRVEYDYDVEGRTQSVKDRRGNTTVYTYDDNGNVLQTVDAYGNKTTNSYDRNNNLLTATDAKGNTTGYAYDASGNVTQVTAADGTKVKSTYTQENLVSSVSMADRTVMAMEYDSKGRIASVEDANGNETTYSYTSDGRLTGLVDSIGEYQRVTYDSEGNVASTANGAGESASYTYDKDGRVTSVTVSREEDGAVRTATSHYSYNAAGDITESIDNAGNVIKYEYDDNGRLTASVDAKGRRITYAYDDMGNMTKTTYPDGTFETFAYDANGNNVAATDRNGLAVTMVYDKLDRMTEKRYADGTRENYVYDAVGNVMEMTNRSGARTVYTYDERYRNTAVTDTYGNVTSFEYDASARLTKRVDAKGNAVTYTYDDNGNMTKTTYADGNSVTSEYDARNRITRQEDPNGNETIYTYDGADRLTGVTDAYGSSYTYGYDGNGNLETVTDANGNVTRYVYDDAGRVSAVTNALGKTMEYAYDETGNLVQSKDYAGTVTKYAYDDMDRMVKKTIGTDVTEYTYDKNGLLLAVTDKSGTVRYTYDKYDRLAKRTDEKGSTLSYTYDKAGRLETFDNGFGTTTYEYDLLDRVTKVIDRNGKATLYEYDELGNRSAVRYPNGNVVTYTYDACQRLKEECAVNADGVQISKYSYGTGRAGERTSVTETNSGVETEITYKYDRLNRLVKETIERNRNKLTYEYSYDKVGNRTEKTVAIKGDILALADVDLEEVQITEGTTTYAYNALNQLVTETSPEGNIAYMYDANGNLVKQTGSKAADYAYDKENHLTRASIRQGDSGIIEEYTYDHAGNRTSKTVNGKDTTFYVNDTSGELAMVVAETDKDGRETAYYTRGEELLSVERGGAVWYYLYDGHGSARTLTNEAGRITDRYSYDAYGNLLEKEGDTENEFIYTGEQYNANTGLYYLRARYMNPSTGTFISMDNYEGSIYDPVSLHKYLYANANPVMYTDPSGYATDKNLAETAVAATIAVMLASSVALHNQAMLNIFSTLRKNMADAVMSLPCTVSVTDWKNVILGFPAHEFDTKWLITIPMALSSWQLFEAIYATDEDTNNLPGVPENQEEKNRVESIPAEEQSGVKVIKSKKSKESDKGRATDIPSWAEGEEPQNDENGKAFAERLMNERYGKGNWPKTKQQNREYSQLKKYGDRGFKWRK